MSAVFFQCRNLVSEHVLPQKTLGSGHLTNFLLLSFKIYEKFTFGKINKGTALMVAYETRGMGTIVGESLIFHSVLLKNIFNYLKL